jgi:hypothetical protein
MDHRRDVVLDHLSYIGYQWRSDSGGEVQCPPDGSGFKVDRHVPVLLDAFHELGNAGRGSTPGLCGNMAAGTK